MTRLTVQKTQRHHAGPIRGLVVLEVFIQTVLDLKETFNDKEG